ncbi:hypothetical protein SUGI_0254190 [Cryptomeria japonica]|uniref:DNA polymerase kappa isoform X2 n=1 Tax=Cryptomeria japonica TaxID=3369 RepID=UPI002408A2D5|nr:DNA polymerase kappa isoform X2 [Cryptomeria japonica]GLJ15483.1 hypothetical protein SUGI_0254190 [Cryptomeria japonica]
MAEEEEKPQVQPWQSFHTVYTNAKAGMDGVDREKVQKVVYEMSKGSKYFENEKRREAYIQQRIDNLCCQAALLTSSDIAKFERVADRRVLGLEGARDLSRTWMHVDMDAFYAAVETLENPSLAGKPMAVGNMSMICTANYEARKFGVRAAMPGFIARKLCPDLVFVPTNFQKYSHYSELTRKVFHEYDSRFIARSLDEAYLDVTDVCKERCMSGEKVAEEIRSVVYAQTGLTCSAGIAPNRLLAKVCSDINKPNGQFVLPNEQPAIMTFVSSLPIRKVNGIGKVTEHMLKDALGITTCGDLLQKRASVFALFSRCSADFFLSVGLGLGGVDSPQEEHRKSISTERTFRATNNEIELFKKLDDIAETLSRDMEKESLRGRTLTLKLKTEAFEVRTRAVSLQSYIYLKPDILVHASKLLRAELPLSLRLMGLRISQFKDESLGPSDPTQKTLTSYLSSGNTRQFGSHKNYSDAEGDAFDSRDADTRYSSEGFIANEIHDPDAMDIYSANSLFRYYHPQDHLDDPRHKPTILKGDTSGEETVVSECLISEIKASDKVENYSSTRLGSSPNFIQGAHDWDLHYAKDEVLPAAPDQSDCESIYTGTNKKSKCSSTLYNLGKNEQSIRSSSSTVGHDIYADNEHLKCDSLSGNNENQVKADLLSGFSDIMFWVDDFKCSLCGSELPSSFIEERQEHTDYHLAQMLQEEESPLMAAHQVNRQQNKRPADLALHGSKHFDKNRNTKNKTKHVPIDSFFNKAMRPF